MCRRWNEFSFSRLTHTQRRRRLLAALWKQGPITASVGSNLYKYLCRYFTNISIVKLPFNNYMHSAFFLQVSELILQSPVCLVPPCLLQTTPPGAIAAEQEKHLNCALMASLNMLHSNKHCVLQAATGPKKKKKTQETPVASLSGVLESSFQSALMQKQHRWNKKYLPAPPAALVLRVAWKSPVKNGKK